ncbi:ribonuclease J [Pararhodospirillum photometricum]|uniref:Metallo-beta-lactamase n=1 Tax=Pararhodospirillum photometricum DSM 122 TaxID=1150469 RepID=H6SNK5_PARPM|nr:ribonuclease J [Pararhodospirillum photometricum]CCG09336.1 Metallo-beta-lactamase [Pararhodospirillum photometricum DSM 122]
MAEPAPPSPPRFEEDALYFVPLGGAGEIGMNLSLYGYRGRWLMVDLGITFGNDTTPGVEVIVPDPSFIEERRDDLLGLVITHAHEDHLGAVPYLWPFLECPVYATPFAAEFLRHKLREEGLNGDVELTEVRHGERFTLGPFDLELIATPHSIPEASHLVVRTEAGTVFHTADWKHDPEPLVGAPADEDRLRRLGDEGVLAVVGDSTNIFNKDHTGSEGEVRRSLVEVFAQQTGRIAVACFASNIARLESIALAAKACGRDVALVGRSLWRMHDTAKACGYLTEAPRFLTDEEGAYLPRDKVVYVCTGSQGEPRAALRRIAFDTHPHVTLGKGDVVIFSSRIIPGNERPVLEVQNRLASLGVSMITPREALVHVSGHPGAQDVRNLYGWIRPSVVLPVHGERMHLDEHAIEARALGIPTVLTAINGQVVRLDGAEAGVVGSVSVGRLAVDGERLIPLDSEVVRDRRRMALGGAVVVSAALDDKGRVVGDPRVAARGLLDPKEDAEDIEEILEIVRGTVAGLRPPERLRDEAVEEAIRVSVRRFFRQSQGRRPVTDVHVLRV